MGMNRSSLSFLHSNRPMSRRLHRRFSLPASSRPSISAQETLSVAVPQVLLGLPGDRIKEAGMLELLAAESRIAELEKALEEASNAAFTDPLTGALNRRGFESAYAREMARARRHGSRVSLAMIDLDDFKLLNDACGHLAGDKVLVHLVAVLQRAMRPSDVLCRFGGEEFVLMLPETRGDDACRAVQRFLREFSSCVLPDVGLSMTFSAGVVEHDCFESLDEAIQRADLATYAAKRGGKNRVMVG